MRTPTFGILIVFFALTVVGFALIPQLSLRYLPNLQKTSITVRYAWPGASPEMIEQNLTAPLEGAFELINGIASVSSVSGQAQGHISVQLEKEASVDLLRFELSTKIRQLYPQFPLGAGYPTLELNSPIEEAEERPILIYSLSGQDKPYELATYTEKNLGPALAMENDLNNIRVTGGNALEWRIAYDQNRLSALGLSTDLLVRQLQQAFQSEGLGMAHLHRQSVALNLKNATDQNWASIPIQMADQRLIRLGDLAEIRLQEQAPLQYYRINGENSVRLLLYAQPNANFIELAARLKSRVTEMSTQLPASYKLRLEEDNTRFLQKELQKIRQRTVMSLGVLLLFVLIIYRSSRYLGLVVMSLIVNLGLACILYYALSIEINLYALAGITVSFGIMIDNTLVMVHHLEKQRNLSVFPALLASTLTTIATLLVIYFLPDQWRLNLLAFAQVMAVNLGISLLVALFFIPALMRQWKMRKKQAVKSTKRVRRSVRINQFYERYLRWALRWRPWLIGLVILGFGLPVYKLPNQIKDWEWYNRSLGNDYYVENIKPVVNRVLGGTLRLFDWYVYEGSAYREPSETLLYVRGSLPQGATVHQLNAVVRQMERYLDRYPDQIRRYTTQVNSGQSGTLIISFNEGYEWSFPYRLKSELIAYSLNMGGAKWNIYGVGKGFSNASGASPPRFRVAMYGYNKDILETQARRFADKLLVHPRIQEVNTDANFAWRSKDQYEYFLELEEDRLAMQQLGTVAFAKELEGFNRPGQWAFSMSDGTPVRLISRQQQKRDLWQLQNQAFSVDSSRVSLSEVGRIGKRKVANAIHKEDQQYIKMVEFEYTGSHRFGSKYLEEVMEQMRLEMPLGYSMKQRQWSFVSEQKRLNYLILLVVVLIFFICSIHFNSLRQALSIVVLIPISFIGIFLTFYLFDLPFDQGGYTSFLLVSGLVVNGMILLVSDYKRFQKKQRLRCGRALFRKALSHKFTPIVLTILSTIVGLIPFMLYGQEEVFWYALAAGTIGGLSFSVFLLLFVIPLFFVKRGRDAAMIP
jgi:multidrug efflux pump subunit AcrB